jgi:hypothetical protein
MKNVSDAIFTLEKWYGDIEPISMMEDAWSRVKGIPMKLLNRSTTFYVACMVGEPLVLDKIFL